jgi:ATP-dependent DNA helicase RecG
MSPSWRTETFRRLAARLDTVLGAKTAKAFEPLRIQTVRDLLQHLPRRYFSGTELSDLSLLQPGEEVAVLAQVTGVSSKPIGRGKFRLNATISDRRGSVSLTFFGNAAMVSYWKDQLSASNRGIFAGKVNVFQGQLQLSHPDFVMLDGDGRQVGGAKRNAVLSDVTRAPLIGLYPATSKLRTWQIAQCARLALDQVTPLEDPLPEWIVEDVALPSLEQAFRSVHVPQSMAEVERGRARLRFDEAFALQLAMACRRADAAAHGAVPRPARDDGLLAAFDARLPFTLTEGQQEVAATIAADLARPVPMQRLLQGEVGSGKTIVALRAMLTVVDAGGQAALLAPTEVLAAQHYQTVLRLMGDLAGTGLLAVPGATGVVLLTGSLGASARRSALLQAASGEAGIVIGTHALLHESVQFADLGLVVVDEQHRFGVEQRAALGARAAVGARPHVLVMTATPIPRTVAMTVFGDLEVSTLREVPAGRAEISTVVVDAQRHPHWVDRAWQRVIEEVRQGRQAYVVCARISSEASPTQASARGGASEGEPDQPEPRAAEDVFAELSSGPLADVRVDLVHGQLSSEDKEAAMARFQSGETDVLVATTVIEVGVDVPNASVMVIHDADRFGISQLHQLRGRIGRGRFPGVCLLLTTASEDSPARHRLDAVASTRDGFALAEVDLEQRREGDVLGASQSGGRSSLRLLRVLEDADVIVRARELAVRCLARDPDLTHGGLHDIVIQVESDAAGEWLERT